MKIKKLLILFFLFSSFFFLFKQTANGYALCSTGDTEHAYTSKDYSCNRNTGCYQAASVTRYGNCDDFSASTQYWENGGECGFCGVADETCTETLREDSFGNPYYQCSYGRTYKPNGVYCQYAKWISCGAPETPCKQIDCTNKCGIWSRGIGCPIKDCGKCRSGYKCNQSTKRCEQTNTCIPESFCGNNYYCDAQNDGCGGIYNCGSCQPGYSCGGKNTMGREGTCRRNPTPTPSTGNPNQIIGMVFYDKYGTSSNKKGSEPTYNNCYPATSTAGAGPNNASVSLVVDSGNGAKTENYTKTSYKNCTRNGTSNKGFILDSQISCKSVRLNLPSGYRSTGYNYQIGSGSVKVVTTGQLNRTPVICGNVTVRFGIERVPPSTQVSGIVYVDSNGNNQYEPGDASANNPEGNSEECYVGSVPISLSSSGNKTFTSTKACNSFSFTKVAGTETVSLGTIAKYTPNGIQYTDNNHLNWTRVDGGSSIAINGNGEIRFGIRPDVSTFSISGNIFTDDKTPFKEKGSTENNYCGGANSNRTITVYDSETGLQVGSTFQRDSASGQCGSGYSVAGLDPGNYKVVYTSLPSGYDMQYPVNNPPPDPSFFVTVGGACSTLDFNSDTSQGTGDLHAQATCVNGDIQNLNFGIIPQTPEPWFQSVGGDVRSDTENISKVPSTGGTCGGVTYTPYLSATTSTLDPGVVFSAKMTDLAGSADRSNIRKWLLLGNTFDPVRPGTIRTSYSYLLNTISRGGVQIKQMFGSGNVCSGSGGAPDCTLPTTAANFPSGVYQAKNINGTDATLRIKSGGSPYTFPANGNYIILVEGGNLRINRDIIVPTTTTVIFAVDGSVAIDENVTRIDGMFSADQDFTIHTNGVNNIDDETLVVNGNIVVNADQNKANPGVINNQRDLGNTDNAKCPALQVKTRPDFILNAPATVRYPNYIIQEVAP